MYKGYIRYLIWNKFQLKSILLFFAFLIQPARSFILTFSFVVKFNLKIKAIIVHYSIKKDPEKIIQSKLESFHSWMLANSLSETTANTHFKALRMFCRETHIIYPIRDDVLKYLGTIFKLGKSKSHARNFINAVEWYMKFIGTPETFPKPKKSKRIVRETLDEKEIRSIICQCKNLREKAIITTLAYSGLRVAELCSLKTSDINQNERSILVRSGKGDKDRVVMISRECRDVLQDYITHYKKAFDDYLFRNVANQNRINRERVTKLLKKIAMEINIKKRVFPHLMRHSLATNLLHNGCDIYHIQQQLGHADIRTTMIYIHSNVKLLKEMYDKYCPKYVLPYEQTVENPTS